MRFDRYPLDQHSCKFMVGSSNYDETRMTFSNLKLHFDQSSANTIVDYQIEIGGKLYTCEEYLTKGINQAYNYFDQASRITCALLLYFCNRFERKGQNVS